MKAADEKTVADVQARAESGELRNCLDGEYRSRGKIEVLGYRDERRGVPAGHELPRHAARHGVTARRRSCKGVDDLTMPVGTREAVVPRAYVIPARAHGAIVAKLRAHNIRVQPLERPCAPRAKSS